MVNGEWDPSLDETRDYIFHKKALKVKRYPSAPQLQKALDQKYHSFSKEINFKLYDLLNGKWHSTFRETQDYLFSKEPDTTPNPKPTVSTLQEQLNEKYTTFLNQLADDTLWVIENNPERTKQAQGIREEMAQDIRTLQTYERDFFQAEFECFDEVLQPRHDYQDHLEALKTMVVDVCD